MDELNAENEALRAQLTAAQTALASAREDTARLDYRKIAYELWNNNWLDKESIDDAATLIEQMVRAALAMLGKGEA